MKIDFKYQAKDLFKLQCPVCQERYQVVNGKGVWVNFPYPEEDAYRLTSHERCFVACKQCQLSVTFNRGRSSRLFLVHKYYYQILDIDYLEFFNITPSDDISYVSIQGELGEHLGKKKLSTLDRSFFLYLEKLKLLRN